MAPSVKRTYGCHTSSRTPIPSSPISDNSETTSRKRKRPLLEHSSLSNAPMPKKRTRVLDGSMTKSSAKSQTGKAKPQQQKKLTQLHFALDVTVLRTCPLCDLSYTKGAPDDESLHRSHCGRVQRGLEWGKEEEREMQKAGVEEVATSVKLKDGSKGRIICFRPDIGGKIGAKLNTLLQTISLALSSPPLSQNVLQHSKIYLFLLASQSKSSSTSMPREKVVGCVVAQRISTAMAIASNADIASSPSHDIQLPTPSTSTPATTSTAAPGPRHLIPVDSATNLYVHPAKLPTPMGIPRLFVSSTHRRLGIASQLLNVAAATFILGCPLDPAKGEVAFTQPTGAGKAVLESWGKGAARIYDEEQGR